MPRPNRSLRGVEVLAERLLGAHVGTSRSLTPARACASAPSRLLTYRAAVAPYAARARSRDLYPPFGVTTVFADLMSRRRCPAARASSSAPAICARAPRSGRRRATRCETLARFRPPRTHRDEVHPVLLADVVDVRDVRRLSPRRRAPRARSAGDTTGLRTVRGRIFTATLRLSRCPAPVDLPHAPRAQGYDDHRTPRSRCPAASVTWAASSPNEPREESAGPSLPTWITPRDFRACRASGAFRHSQGRRLTLGRGRSSPRDTERAAKQEKRDVGSSGQSEPGLLHPASPSLLMQSAVPAARAYTAKYVPPRGWLGRRTCRIAGAPGPPDGNGIITFDASRSDSYAGAASGSSP